MYSPRPYRALLAGRPRAAFTLIEILIVVVILGILAGIVIPQFSSASSEARESTCREALRYLRVQAQAYKYQHLDRMPGYPGGNPTATPDEASTIAQLTQYSDEFGATNATQTAVYRFGPYLSAIPENPVNGKTGVWVDTGATMPAADPANPAGWIYNPVLEKFLPNQPGYDSAGKLFASY